MVLKKIITIGLLLQMIPLTAFGWTLFGENPIRELKPLEKFYVEKLGGYNQKSFCRWSAINLSGDNLQFSSDHYYQCMDAVTNGKGMYGEKDRWKKNFESSLQAAIQVRGANKNEDSEFLLQLNKALSRIACNIMIKRDYYKKQKTNTVGQRRTQFENALKNLDKAESLNDDWANSADFSLPKAKECIEPCGGKALAEQMCCNEDKQFKLSEGMSRNLYGSCQCESGNLRTDMYNTYVKCN